MSGTLPCNISIAERRPEIQGKKCEIFGFLLTKQYKCVFASCNTKENRPHPWIADKGGKVPREVGSAAMRIQYHNSMVLSAKIPLNLYSSSTMQEDKNAMR